MVEIRQVCPWLGVLLHNPPHLYLCDTLLSLVDGQNYESRIQRGGIQNVQNVVTRHRLRNGKSADEQLLAEILSQDS